MTLLELNGGFPEPPAGARVRVVSARHEACGETTRLRLPEALPAQTVRRVVCQACAQPFESPAVVDVGPFPRFDAAPTRTLALETQPAAIAPRLSAPRFSLPRLSIPQFSLPQFSLPQLSLPGFSFPDPAGAAWRYLSVPVAAAAVIGILLLAQGSGGQQSAASLATAARQDAAAATAGGAHGGAAAAGAAQRGSGNARFMRESTFSLALPRGWQQTTPAAGATFAASAPGGEADATLWVERDPTLDFASFEARSIDQLRQLAGSAHIVDRVAAPTADASVVKLAADAPPNTPRYEVTLRASGPYRYYLATTLQPNAPAAAAEGVDLVHGSFLPQGAK